MSDAPSSDEAQVVAVHVRFDTHPEQRQRRIDWVEPPLGLGYHHGRYEVIGRSADLDGLVRWVLGFGPCAEVVGPDVLRQRVVQAAHRIAARYDDVPPHVKFT